MKHSAFNGSWYTASFGTLLVAILSGAAVRQTPTQVGFAPGGQDLFVLDLAGARAGTIPRGIQRLSGSLSVVNMNGLPMLRATETSEFLIALPVGQVLPQNFTIELDVIPKDCCPPPDLTIEGTASINQGSGSAHLLLLADAEHGSVYVIGGASENFELELPERIRATLPGALTKVGVSVEGSTIRLFINGQPVYTRQAWFARGPVLRVTLGGSMDDQGSIKPVYLARARVATGAPATVATALPATTTGTMTGVVPIVTQPVSGSTSPIAGAPSTGSPLSAVAPTGFKVAASTPTSISFAWDPVPNVSGFTLLRSTGRGQPFTTVATTPASATTYQDGHAIDYRATYIYRLSADYPSSVSGFVDLIVSLPKPSDPTNFTSTVAAPANVHLSWQPVPGATGYLISGPGLAQGVTVNGTSHVASNAPVGINVYRVASVFGAAGVLTANNAWPATVARVAAQPVVPFLNMANGPGSNGYAVGHNNLAGVCGWRGWWYGDSCASPTYLGHVEAVLDFWGRDEKGQPTTAAIVDRVLSETVSFADPLDLGGGRRVWCGTHQSGALCIASTHGPVPGTPGFGDAQRDADAAATNSDNRGYTVISQQKSTGRLNFYQFGFPDGADPGKDIADPVQRFRVQLLNSFIVQSGNAFSSKLDTQGSKTAPHVCLSCHGGRFNSADNSVIGGSLLPIDPSRLVFSGTAGATRADQEARIRSVNGVVSTASTPMVKEYIDGLYGSGWGLKVANTTAVPKGWSNQQGLWNQVVRPYCIMCHMAQTGPLALASYNDLVFLKDRVQKAVCTDATMPHSEVLFKRFWSDGGSVLLPGLLSTALGFPSCP